MAETITQTKTEKEQFKWATIEEVESLEKHLFRRFVKKNDDKSAKKFFFKVLGFHKDIPGGSGPDAFIPNGEEFRIMFEVQKYYRDRKVKTVVRDAEHPQISRDAEVPQQVNAHELRGSGDDQRWVCVDREASFFMEMREFLSKFQYDAE